MDRRGAIIAYQLTALTPAQRPRFNERILGLDRRVGDRTYRRRGLFDEIPHWKVGRGVVVIAARDRVRVVRELRQWTRQVEWWEVELTPRQQRRLRLAVAS